MCPHLNLPTYTNKSLRPNPRPVSNHKPPHLYYPFLGAGGESGSFYVVWCPYPIDKECAVSPPQQSMYGVPPSQYMLSFNVVRCPHPFDKVCAVSPPQQSECGVPTLQVYDFPRTQLFPPSKKYVRCPPSNVVLCLGHTWLCLRL